MGVRIERVKGEVFGFGEAVRSNLREVFITNAPRYKRPQEWLHLWADLWVSAVSILKAAVMPYTYGHLLAVAVPLLLILS